MNAFIPQNPRVVLAVDGTKIVSINNIDPDLEVTITTVGDLSTVGAGLPFDSRNPRPQTQVLAQKRGK